MPFNNGELPSIKNLLLSFVDELNRLLIVLWLISFIVSIFIKNFIVDILPFLLIALIIFRLFSKNKEARKKENKIFLKIVKGILKPFDNVIRNVKDRNNYVYKKCHKCKTILKLPLPNRRGINHAKCPNCGKRVTLFTLRKVKVEVIKKKR